MANVLLAYEINLIYKYKSILKLKVIQAQAESKRYILDFLNIHKRLKIEKTYVVTMILQGHG